MDFLSYVLHHNVIYIYIRLLSKCNGNWSVRCELLAISLAGGTWRTLNLHINTDPHRITVRTDGMLLLFLKISAKEVSWIMVKLMDLKRAFTRLQIMICGYYFWVSCFLGFFFTMPHIQRLTLCALSLLFRGAYNHSCIPPSLQYQMGDCGVSH